MSMDEALHLGYHVFHNEDGESYGSYEVFHSAEYPYADLDNGYYWVACFPGCLPDSETPTGPFETALEARQDADEFLPVEELEG